MTSTVNGNSHSPGATYNIYRWWRPVIFSVALQPAGHPLGDILNTQQQYYSFSHLVSESYMTTDSVESLCCVLYQPLDIAARSQVT